MVDTAETHLLGVSTETMASTWQLAVARLLVCSSAARLELTGLGLGLLINPSHSQDIVIGSCWRMKSIADTFTCPVVLCALLL